MFAALLLLLILFWLFAYTPLFSQFLGTNIPNFFFFGRTFTLWDIVLLLLIAWAIGILPTPLRQIAGVILILWLLSVLGIFALFPGSSSILVLIIIAGVFLSLLGGGSYGY